MMKVIIILVVFLLFTIETQGNIIGRRLAKGPRSQPRFHHHEHVVSEVRSHGHHHPSFRTVVHGKIHSVSALQARQAAVRESVSYHKGLVDGALRGTHGHTKGQIVPPKVRMSSTLAHHSRPHQHIHVHHVHTHGGRA